MLLNVFESEAIKKTLIFKVLVADLSSPVAPSQRHLIPDNIVLPCIPLIVELTYLKFVLHSLHKISLQKLSLQKIEDE